VLAVNGAYKHLLAAGIVPGYFMLIDSRECNPTHVEAPHERTQHYLASQVHPEVFDRLAGYRVTLLHLGTSTAVETVSDPDADFLPAPIGMASVHAVNLGAALGHRNQFLFGYDFSRKGEESYAF